MKSLFMDKLSSVNSAIFYANTIEFDEHLFKGKLISFDVPFFSIQALLKNPFQRVLEYRKLIKETKGFCKMKVGGFTLSKNLKIIIGTDKDNFTQILINKLFNIKNLEIELMAVEEGSGFYRKETNKDIIVAFLYRMLTPVLFNEKIKYHRQLGTDKRISKVYARLPECIPKTRNSKNVTYIKYGISKKREYEPNKANGLLIYSFPNKNYPISDTKKTEILKQLILHLGKNKDVFIKPHPRELMGSVKSLKGINILNKKSTGEDLDYFNFEKIVNFSSSIVIDLIESGYPKERIVTVKLDDSNLTFFKETNYVDISDINKL